MSSDITSSPYGTFPAYYARARLADLCVEDGGIQTGPFGSQLHSSDYVVNGTPIITVEHIGENRILHDGAPTVSEADRQRLSRYSLRKGDIVFSRVGSVDRRALVREEEDGWLFSGRCLRVRPKPDAIDSAYLAWFLGLPAFREYMRSIALGATMPTLNTRILADVPVYFPPFPEQRAIAYILGCLDDKIELSRRMNGTLEAMAQAIFKSWFVDFDPVRAKAEGRQPVGMDAATAALFPDSFEKAELGEIPRGWRVGTITDLLAVVREALTPADYPDEVFDHYSVPAYDGGRTPKPESGINIKSAKHTVPDGAVLVSKLNPRFPRVWMPLLSREHRSICSTEFFGATPRKGFSRDYLYALLGSESFCRQFAILATGTSGSHQRVRPKDFLGMQALIPDPPIVARFSGLAAPMYELAAVNLLQSQTLTAIRDAVLPKLVSGEVRPGDAQRIAGNAA